MQAMLHGYRRIDMTDRDTGRQIKGLSCYISYPEDGVEGRMVSKQFVSDALISDCRWSPEIGKPVNFEINFRGKVSGVSTVHEK